MIKLSRADVCRIMWTMDDDDVLALEELAISHVNLVNRYRDNKTLPEHRLAIESEIITILDQRDAIMQQYRVD